ncbi:hypothetical protein MTsPCn5_14650 [Croceitalea sp. MTPC5]|uniref:carboxypeptidase-like regulatory domain-containing protein n=1 Tax=Croceitalea sp. MTPC5 TaxID=3056565 RepID=UPI002B3E6F03|nr:hypothetical protein MTsPCn5_14650 [Croceitalea sp. MTPC5]
MKYSSILQLSFIFFIGYLESISGQIKGVILDSSSLEIVPYANIWIQKSDFGVNSDKNGRFILPQRPSGSSVLFSALGYVSKEIQYGLVNDTVWLNPKIIELNEVVVKLNIERRKRKVVEKIKRSKVGHYLPGFSSPYTRMYAKYFEYKEGYNKTPFLNKIRVVSRTDLQHAPFNIKLLAVGRDGKPSTYIYEENIIGVAESGKKLTKIDISNLQIPFPEKGFFIAVEWLLVRGNQSYYNSFHPEIGFTQESTDLNGWEYKNGSWSKTSPYIGEVKSFKDKFKLLAVEVVLSN